MQEVNIIPKSEKGTKLIIKYNLDDDRDINRNRATKTFFNTIFEKDFSHGIYTLRLKQEWPSDKLGALILKISNELEKDGLEDNDYYIEVKK